MNNESTASIDLAQLDSLQRYADSCVPTALPSEKLGALIALARRSLTSGAPADFVMMPKRLTAENGAKGALSGEFKESVRVTCHECGGSGDDPEFDGENTEHGSACAECNGEGTVEQSVPVSWDTIKDIYKSAVDLLAAPIHGAAAPSAELRTIIERVRDGAKEWPGGWSSTVQQCEKALALLSAGAAAKSEQAPLAKEPDLRSVLKEIPLCYPWGTGRKLVREGTSRDWVSVRESTGSTQTLAPMNQNIVNSTIAAVLRAISSDAGSEHAGVSQQAGVHAGELADERALFGKERVIEMAFDAGLGHSAMHPDHYPAYARFAEIIARATLAQQGAAQAISASAGEVVAIMDVDNGQMVCIEIVGGRVPTGRYELRAAAKGADGPLTNEGTSQAAPLEAQAGAEKGDV